MIQVIEFVQNYFIEFNVEDYQNEKQQEKNDLVLIFLFITFYLVLYLIQLPM